MFPQFIHVVSYISTSFPFMVKYYSIVCAYHVFIHLSIDGHLDCSTFQLLWIMLLWIFTYKFLCGHVSVSQHLCRHLLLSVLHFFDGWFSWASFHVLIGHSCIIREMFTHILCPFRLLVFLLLSCKNSFCVLDISPISDTWFAVFFPHFVSCFSLSYSVFEVQMFLILMRSNLLLVLLVSYLRIHCPI